MRKIIKYGNPVSLVIMVDSIDAVFIDNLKKNNLVYWLRGGEVQRVILSDEKECQSEMESVLGILSED
jgi:hypothetical protein